MPGSPPDGFGGSTDDPGIPGQAVFHHAFIEGGDEHIVVFTQTAADVFQYLLLLFLLLLVQGGGGIYQAIDSGRGLRLTDCGNAGFQCLGIGGNGQGSASGQRRSIEKQIPV